MGTADTATGRAKPLPLEERREALLEATIRIIRQSHELPTTRQIAVAAGVAEGTIFRAFATKDELFDTVLERTFDANTLYEGLAKIDGSAGLEAVMTDIVRLLQARFLEIFDVMGAFGLMGPPERFRDAKAQGRQGRKGSQMVLGLLEPYADQLRLPVDRVARMTRLLTFAGSHRHINDGEVLPAEDIVQTILYGTATTVLDGGARPHVTRKRKGLKTQEARGQ